MECCIREGELLRLDSGAGLTLRCTSGIVWVTRGDGVDYLLTPGRCFELPRGENALVEGLQASQLYMGETVKETGRAVIRLAAC